MLPHFYMQCRPSRVIRWSQVRLPKQKVYDVLRLEVFLTSSLLMDPKKKLCSGINVGCNMGLDLNVGH